MISTIAGNAPTLLGFRYSDSLIYQKLLFCYLPIGEDIYYDKYNIVW